MSERIRRLVAVESLLDTGTATWRCLNPDGLTVHNGQIEMVHHICPLDGQWKEEAARLCATCERDLGPIIDKRRSAVNA